MADKDNQVQFKVIYNFKRLPLIKKDSLLINQFLCNST